MVTEHMRGVTRHLASGPEKRENTVKKMIIAAIGGALLTGPLLEAGLASADPPYATVPQHAQTARHRSTRVILATAIRPDRDGDGVACE